MVGIGAKPAVGPFERIGLNNTVGGIQVSLMISLLLMPLALKYTYDQCQQFSTFGVSKFSIEM